MTIQPNTDMTGNGSARVGIVTLIVTFVATKSVKQYYLRDNKYSISVVKYHTRDA